AKKQGREYINYYVPVGINQLRIIPLFIRPITWKIWQPSYPVELISLNDKIIKQKAIIDSGADMTCIPYKIGLKLGFLRSQQESTIIVIGIGGEVEILQRDITLKIDGHQMNVPAAWIQDEKVEMELLIGRLKVFDYFDITFKQADKKIEFYWRGQDNNRAAELAVEYSLEHNKVS
ncbi:MAG: retropepsin-like domain-containing protein, partial [Bacteroidetes bacterium]|nr:retropepsin-like domain-containing protein [Bacteroidota bacterium]